MLLRPCRKKTLLLTLSYVHTDAASADYTQLSDGYKYMGHTLNNMTICLGVANIPRTQLLLPKQTVAAIHEDYVCASEESKRGGRSVPSLMVSKSGAKSKIIAHLLFLGLLAVQPFSHSQSSSSSSPSCSLSTCSTPSPLPPSNLGPFASRERPRPVAATAAVHQRRPRPGHSDTPTATTKQPPATSSTLLRRTRGCSSW